MKQVVHARRCCSNNTDGLTDHYAVSYVSILDKFSLALEM